MPSFRTLLRYNVELPSNRRRRRCKSRGQASAERVRDRTRIISQEPAGLGAAIVHLLILLLQHLLGRLLDKPQLQPETVRPRQPGPADETAECRGLSFASFGWLTVLFVGAPNLAPSAAPSFARSRLRTRACCAGGNASPTSSFLSFSRRTLRISLRLRP